MFYAHLLGCLNVRLFRSYIVVSSTFCMTLSFSWNGHTERRRNDEKYTIYTLEKFMYPVHTLEQFTEYIANDFVIMFASNISTTSS